MNQWAACGLLLAVTLANVWQGRCEAGVAGAVAAAPLGGPAGLVVRVPPPANPPPANPSVRPVAPRPIRPSAPTPGGLAKFDSHGDPLPFGAVSRFGTVRLRHGGEIAALGFSPDGSLLGSVSATEDGIRLWDPRSGKEIARLDGSVAAAAFGRDGSLVVAEPTRWRIWLPTKGNVIRELPKGGFPENATAIDVHPDCRSIAAGAAGKVAIVDLATGKLRVELKVPGDQAPLRIAYSSDGRWLAAGGQKTGVWLWDMKGNKRVRTYPLIGENANPCEFAFSPDSARLAIVGDQLRVYPIDSEEPEDGFAPSENVYQRIRFSADGKMLIGQLSDGSVVRMDAASGVVKETWPPPEDFSLKIPVAFSVEGQFAAGADDSGGIRIWEPRIGKGPQVDRLPVLSDPFLSSDGKLAICLDAEGRVRTFDATTGMPGKVQGLSVEAGNAVVLDGKRGRAAVVVGDEDIEVQIVETASGKVVARVPVAAANVNSVEFFPTDPDRLVVFSQGAISAVRISTGKALRTFLVGQQDALLRGAISPDGRLVAVTTSPLSVWEIESGKKRFEIDGVPNPTGVAFASDGRTLAAWEGGEAALFDVRTGIAGRRLRYPAGESTITAAAFSPNGVLFATGCQDGLLTLWNTTTGDPVLNLDRHEAMVSGMAFSTSGKSLISTSADGTALIWDVAAKPDTKPGVVGSEEAFRLIAAADPALAQRGLEFLYRRGPETVELLRAKIPVPTATPADRIATLMGNLASSDFQTRQTAIRELESIGSEAVSALRLAVANSTSPEVTKLAASVLGRIDGPPSRPEDLRAIRAVEVLEGIGSPDARALLKTWAAGPHGHRLSMEAAAALKRLEVVVDRAIPQH